MKKTVFVLGHKGMLGHVVTRYLREQNHEVLTTDKRFEPAHDCQLLREVKQSNADVIINCIGKIRQKTIDPDALFMTNAVLPIQLVQSLNQNQKMIQVSSDCVFSGKSKNPYTIDCKPDPIDPYGASKAAGEIVALDSRVIMLRTSIIGPEIQTSFGLFAWFIKNDAKKIQGYVDHMWNGVTTLQLAKVIDDFVMSRRQNDIITHIASQEAVSKYELLKMINEVNCLEKTITPIETKDKVNHELVAKSYEPSIKQQLEDLKDWYHQA